MAVCVLVACKFVLAKTLETSRCGLLSVVMLSVVLLSVCLLSVVLLSVCLLCVVCCDAVSCLLAFNSNSQ